MDTLKVLASKELIPRKCNWLSLAEWITNLVNEAWIAHADTFTEITQYNKAYKCYV